MSRATSTPTMQQQPTTTKMPTHEQISVRAYEKWVKRGRPCGTHVQDWLESEMELKKDGAAGTMRR
jgi:hypothetical protein